MALDKLGNPGFQTAGEGHASDLVHDSVGNQLLFTICQELRLIRIAIQEMADVDMETSELGPPTEEL